MPQENGSAQERRAFIYGSCVTRDAFQLEGLPELGAYFARSPILSAFGARVASMPAGMDIQSIPSRFQQTMVRRDVQKSLPAALRALDEEIVIIDLIDERISVAEFEGGCIAYSTEAKKAGLTTRGAVLRSPTDPDFMERWRPAAQRLAEALGGRPVILNKAFWAVADDAGAPLEGDFRVAANNAVLQQMYQHLESVLSCTTIDYPDSLLIAAGEHKWGRSPFHFIPVFYDHFVSSMNAAL
ncbi:DUF6270 domain-containing protein [Kocuria palustris]|uniref:DUF6270 domain-containing protein n=1 Tax=Kocuria palustris TaxID=71999 RepID=UPI00344FB406